MGTSFFLVNYSAVFVVVILYIRDRFLVETALAVVVNNNSFENVLRNMYIYHIHTVVGGPI